MEKEINDWLSARDRGVFLTDNIPLKKWYFFGSPGDNRFACYRSDLTYNLNIHRYCIVIDFKTGEKLIQKTWNTDNALPQVKYRFEQEKIEAFSEYYKLVCSEVRDYTKDSKYLKAKGLGYQPKMYKKNNGILLEATKIHKETVTGYQYIDTKGTITHRGDLDDTYFMTGNIKDYIFISADYESSATVHKIFGMTAVCCFKEGNLYEVANYFSKKNPFKKIYVLVKLGASSNKFIQDLKSEFFKNGCFNVAVSKPYFVTPIAKFVSYSDLYLIEDSHNEFNEQIKMLLDVYQDFVFPLGISANCLYFYSNKQGISQTKLSLTSSFLLTLADLSFFEKISPKTKHGGIMWSEVCSTFISDCSNKQYDSYKYRTKGIYNEGKKLIINTGKEIIGKPKGKYQYLFNSSIDKHVLPKPSGEFDQSDISLLLSLLKELNFKEKYGHVLLLAWLIYAPFFRALSFRPHIQIEGESSSGKGWLREYIIEKWLKWTNPGLFYGNMLSHPAFLRTEKDRARVCVIDEKENTENASYSEQWLETFRLSCTEYNAKKVVCGTDSHTVHEYPQHSLFCILGINTYIYNPEDMYRFVKVYLKQKGKKEDQINYLSAIQHFDIEKLSLCCYNHMYKNWDAFNKKIKEYYSVFLIMLSSGHSANKLAVICAVSELFLLSDSEQKDFIKSITENEKAIVEYNKEIHIINTIVNYEYESYPVKHTIIKHLRKCKFEPMTRKPKLDMSKDLLYLGIKFLVDTKGKEAIVISKKSMLVNRIYARDYSLANTWFYSLTSRWVQMRTRFGMKNKETAVCIPLSDFVSDSVLNRFQHPKESDLELSLPPDHYNDQDNKIYNY